MAIPKQQIKEFLLQTLDGMKVVSGGTELAGPCPICGERFKPTNTRQKICSNELCKLIYKYDKAIEQHSALRMKELTEEFENRTKKTLIADNTTEINSMFLKDNPKVKTKVNGD